MKKVLTVLAVFTLALSLVGCGSREKKTTASIKQTIGNVELSVVLELYHDGNLVNKQVQKGTFKGKTLEDAEALYEANAKIDYNALAKEKGFDYSIEKKDTSVIENITIDYSQISTETYNKVTASQLDTSKKLQISYEKTIEQFKASGFTITEE